MPLDIYNKSTIDWFGYKKKMMVKNRNETTNIPRTAFFSFHKKNYIQLSGLTEQEYSKTNTAGANVMFKKRAGVFYRV